LIGLPSKKGGGSLMFKNLLQTLFMICQFDDLHFVIV